MNFTCDNCQRRYSIADEKVRGRTVKIRCKNCQNVISVQGPPEEERTTMMTIAEVEKLRAQKAAASAPKNPWEAESTRAAPALDLKAEWFAMIRGKQTGPLNFKALTEKVASGEVTLKSFMWKKGMGDWQRASDIAELALLFAGGNAPAAPPPAAPVPQRTSTRQTLTGQVAAAAPTAQVPVPLAKKTGTHRVAQPIASTPTGADPAWAAAPAPRPAPAPAPSPAPSPTDSLDSLFADPDLPQARTEDHVALGGNGAKAKENEITFDFAPAQTADVKVERPLQSSAHPEDPFKALGAVIDPAKLPPVGESTRFFITQAGVNKRNPLWKIGLFIMVLIGVPVAVMYALSEMKIVPLEVSRVDPKTGQEVKESVFTADGVSGLKDLLLGHHKPAVKPETPIRISSRSTGQPSTSAKPSTPGGPSAADLQALYGNSLKPDVGPKVKAGTDAPAHETGGLAQDAIAKVVGQTMPAFQNCIEQELHRNPNAKLGKISLNATVGRSGIVTQTVIDRRDIDMSELGQCLKARAKRMTFAAFDGDEVEVQIPLILTSSM